MVIPPKTSATVRFQRLWVGGKGGKAPTTKNGPKWRVLDVRGKGEGADYEKHTRLGVFLVFVGRKANEHVKHAHTGVSYVFCMM